MEITTDRSRRATTTTATLLALAASALILAPGAAATGYLVNVEVDPLASAKAGSNPLGGQGDTIDVGAFNHQCSDEDDVVDVGVANQEGTAQEDSDADDGYRCTDDEGDCNTEEGGGVEGTLLGHRLPFEELFETLPDTGATWSPAYVTAVVIDPADERGNGACTDDGDAVDVGLFNSEGRFEADNAEWEQCDDAEDPELDRDQRGDRGDAVDVGVGNWECRDQEDGNDVGLVNCEIEDPDDRIDAGAANAETRDDANDTLDISVLAFEIQDSPDGNGVDILPAASPVWYCEQLRHLFQPPVDEDDPFQGFN